MAKRIVCGWTRNLNITEWNIKVKIKHFQPERMLLTYNNCSRPQDQAAYAFGQRHSFPVFNINTNGYVIRNKDGSNKMAFSKAKK